MCPDLPTRRIHLDPNAPVLKIAVLVDGSISANGSPTTVESLRESLKTLAKQKGVVWYYREAPQGPAPPQAMQVTRLVAENRLPIRLSTRPDYSNSVGTDGRPVGKDGKPTNI
jgi:hypothetical protein